MTEERTPPPNTEPPVTGEAASTVPKPTVFNTPHANRVSSSTQTPSSRATKHSTNRKALAPMIADDLENDSYQILPEEFATYFLNVGDAFIAECEKIFSLDADTDQWRSTVESASKEYYTANAEPDQYKPFLKIINAVLDRATGNSTIKKRFPGFNRALQYAARNRKSPTGGVKKASIYPDIMGEVAIQGQTNAEASWERSLLPLEFKKKAKEKASDATGRVGIGDGRVRKSRQSKSGKATIPSGSKEDYVIKSKSTKPQNRGQKRTPTGSLSQNSAKRTKEKQEDVNDEERNPTYEEQLAMYCLEMFSTGLRAHTYGILIDQGNMTLHHFDRDGWIYTSSFNVFKKWGMFTAILVAFSSFDAHQWGFYHSLDWDRSRCMIPIVNQASALGLNPPSLIIHCEKGVPEDYRLERHDQTTPVDEYSDLDKLQSLTSSNISDIDNTEPGFARVTLMQKVYVQFGLIGRGTVLFLIKQDNTAGEPGIVVKISSQAIQRLPERLYLRIAKQGLIKSNSEHVKNLPVLIGWAQCQQLSDGPRGKLPGSGKIEKGGNSDRRIDIHVFPYYAHIYTLPDEATFKKAIRDCVGCSYDLYRFLQLLHRDISSENLMWDSKWNVAILNDFDLAKLVPEMQRGPYAKHKTGTLPFMALDLLNGWSGEHQYRFELESFLYVIMWIVVRYEDGKEKYDTLRRWLAKHPDFVFASKNTLFSRLKVFKAIPWTQSATFPNIYESWIYPLRMIFSRFIRSSEAAQESKGFGNQQQLVYEEVGFGIEEFLDVLMKY
ncbi:hypothetical protein AMATHDRAFT_7248 [Amanita thiersii Skay4041]|uniref:Protein kinase domain-containing protein n=1 Tax=Amanita thiersii Skay4041 TaxID=703135 RepID=A0A2A9NGU1_9AGAR|nr:hypothetical protein AMATHDRAFT_7248 [Amanita thiersii Skay4041]